MFSTSPPNAFCGHCGSFVPRNVTLFRLQLVNTLSPMVIFCDKNVTSVKLLHPLNAPFPIDVAFDVNVRDVRLVQLLKAVSPIDITSDDIAILLKLLHPKKALLSIEIDSDVIVIEVRLGHVLKALLLIVTSYDDTVKLASPEAAKELFPIDLTLSAIVTLVSLEHS